MSKKLLLVAVTLICAVGANAQSPSAVLYGLDFSPYLTGQDPNLNSQISAAQITSRMQIVAPYTRWIRSFSSTNGLENIPSVARQLGLRVAANAWISGNSAQNNAEINNLIAAANAGRIDIAIVGSEALLRNDVSESQLIAYMNQVRQAIPSTIPVTTADTYGTLLAHPNVIAVSDLLFANFYPYWEGVSINNAICSLAQQYQRLVAAAGPKQVIISETGWPSGGNAVGAAVPSPANAAQFFIQFVTWATTNNVPYFYFDAFYENWKAAYEGPQGAHWGIWDTSGVVKTGMGAVFSGQTSPVACDGTIGGPGTPAVSFTYVPPYGSGNTLEGQVLHVSPASYGVAVYIKVGGGWWTKPTFAQPVTAIQTDGTWSVAIVTGGSDQLATDVAAFLIPSSFSPPQLSGAGALPDSLTTTSVAHVQVQRTQNSISGTVFDALSHPVSGVTISGGSLGTALTAPDGRYSFFNMPASGSVTLMPTYPNLVFTPPSAALNITSGNQTANFTAASTVDLSITSTLSSNSIQAGTSFTATVVASNAGIATATNAVATVSVPFSMSILAVSSTRGSCSTANQQITCDVGALAPTASATITLQATATAAGSFNISASVSGPDPDANPANNNTSQPLTVMPQPISVGVYNDGQWKLDANGNGTFESASDRNFFLGFPGATMVLGDWNGDGRTKVGVYSNGYWFLDYDGNGVWDGGVKDKLVAWGWAGATPIVGDWNGDGKSKIGVFSNGFWFLDYNGDYLWDGGVVDKQVGWGWAGVTPIVGDWNGDGKTKIGIYSNGFWFLDYNGDYLWDGGVVDKQVGWGWAGVTPIVGDWNGDGKTKIGVYAGGYWYIDYDGNYLWEYPAKDKIWSLGWTGTTPVMGDWNGDGKTKPGAFINGYWYLDYNGNGVFDGAGTDRIYAFGASGDTPVVGRW